MKEIVQSFGLNLGDYVVDRIGTGHIHDTYKLTGAKSYVLQRININVFKKPDVIASNLRAASDYLRLHFPEYVFLSSVLTTDGKEMSYAPDGFPWRLFPYIKNSITIDKVETEEEAFGAASAFAELTAKLEGVNVNLFKATIDGFHDLAARYRQFETAIKGSGAERLNNASGAIALCQRFHYLVERYDALIREGTLKPRITHNDTKINNTLIDATTRKPICVINLDTLMPGYFIYDVGDMIRTFVSPANEEETDLTKVAFRRNIYDALVAGYLSKIGNTLSEKEKALFPFAGMMMTYIMALRMLADYLNGDVYYHIDYPEHNHNRAKNQLRLVEIMESALAVK